MAIKITKSEGKFIPAKKKITVNEILVNELKFVNETGDITKQVIDALPVGVNKVSFTISVELPNEESE